MKRLNKKLDASLSAAISATLLQAVVWVYVGVLIAESYGRHVLNPEVPSGEFYGEVYGTLMFVGGLALPGFLMAINAAVRHKYRGRWFFFTSVLLAACLCLLYPVGTMLGGAFILYLCVIFREFFRPPSQREHSE